jgi:hypothetical protein
MRAKLRRKHVYWKIKPFVWFHLVLQEGNRFIFAVEITPELKMQVRSFVTTFRTNCVYMESLEEMFLSESTLEIQRV